MAPLIIQLQFATTAVLHSKSATTFLEEWTTTALFPALTTRTMPLSSASATTALRPDTIRLLQVIAAALHGAVRKAGNVFCSKLGKAS